MKIPDILFRLNDQAEWRAWLAANHALEKEAWFEIKKKHKHKFGDLSKRSCRRGSMLRVD
jgi:uncharacterized protein YdeI (YjbR/CyaY-like superfamily)